MTDPIRGAGVEDAPHRATVSIQHDRPDQRGWHDVCAPTRTRALSCGALGAFWAAGGARLGAKPDDLYCSTEAPEWRN